MCKLSLTSHFGNKASSCCRWKKNLKKNLASSPLQSSTKTSLIPLVNVKFMWLAKALSRIKHNVPHALLRAYQIHSLYYNIWKTFQRNKTIIGTSQHSSCLSCLPLGPISFLTSKKSLTDTKLTRSSVQQFACTTFLLAFS